MFKCCDCGEFFVSPKIRTENMGEHFGIPAYKGFVCCPECDGDVEQAHQCKICGNYFFDDELDDGICEECLEEKLTKYHDKVKSCLEILKDEKIKIEINPVLAMLLKPSVIENILTEYVLNNSFDCKDVVDEYEDWFVEKIKEGVQE
jgi:hypothetical protein